MITEKRQFGNAGEELAVKFLRKKGYKIREQNFNIRQGEIDIVAEFKNEIIFVEVKTRTSDAFGSAFESITRKKADRIITAAWTYLKKFQLEDRLFRIDAVSVTFPGPVIEHLENALEE